MRLAQWNRCGHSNVSVTSWPRWTRGDSVFDTDETWVICEGVTPKKCPASSIGFHLAVGFERVIMGPTINIEPINTGRKVKWRQRLARRKRYFFSWAKSWKLKEEILAINGYQFRIWLVLTTTPSVVWPTRTLTCFTCALKWSNDIGTVGVDRAAVIGCCTFVQI